MRGCNAVACTARQPSRVNSQDARCPPCRPPADANEIRVRCRWLSRPRRMPACTAHGRWGRLLGVQRSRRAPKGPPLVLMHPTSPSLAAGAQGFRPAGPPPLCEAEPHWLTGKLRVVLHGGPRRAYSVAQPAAVTNLCARRQHTAHALDSAGLGASPRRDGRPCCRPRRNHHGPRPGGHAGLASRCCAGHALLPLLG